MFPPWLQPAAGEDQGKVGIQCTTGFERHLFLPTLSLPLPFPVPKLTPGEAEQALILLTITFPSLPPACHSPFPSLPRKGPRMVQSQDWFLVAKHGCWTLMWPHLSSSSPAVSSTSPTSVLFSCD